MKNETTTQIENTTTNKKGEIMSNIHGLKITTHIENLFREANNKFASEKERAEEHQDTQAIER